MITDNLRLLSCNIYLLVRCLASHEAPETMRMVREKIRVKSSSGFILKKIIKHNNVVYFQTIHLRQQRRDWGQAHVS